jgi:hypothetical protein
MSTLVTRAGKGSPLTHNEVDANFTNLNTDKVEKTSADITGGTINGTTVGATTPATGTFTTLTAQTEVLKGTGQNLIAQSQTFDNVGWTKSNATITADSTTAPDGTTTADTLVENTATSTHYVYSNSGVGFYTVLVVGVTYTISVYAKPSGRNRIQLQGDGSSGFLGGNSVFNLSTGTVVSTGSGVTSAAIASAGNGWYRCSITAVATGTVGRPIVFLDNGTTNVYTGDGTSGVFLWGIQSEIGAVANTYIPTTTSQIYGTPTLSFSGVSTIGLESNGSLFVQPAGTGALQAQATTSSAVGGNARGANAVDWQTSRTGATQVASGTQSFLGGGTQNISSSQWTVVVGGGGNTASGFGSALVGGTSVISSGSYSFVGGGQSNTSSKDWSVIGGGNTNTSAGFYNFVGGGFTNSGTSGSAVTTQSATMNATTAVTLSGSNANIKVGQYISGTSISGDTYVNGISGTSLTLSKVASGSSTSTLSFFTPHGVVVGGGFNVSSGSHSFVGGGGYAGASGAGTSTNRATGDWSAIVGGIGNLASGSNSFIGGGGFPLGNGNTASGQSSVVAGGYANSVSGFAATCIGGTGNSANGNYGVVGGANNTNNAANAVIIGGQFGTARNIAGNFVMPACASPIAGVSGVSQAALVILARETTNATATVLCSDTSSASGTNQVILPNNSAYYFKGSVIANVTGAANGASWSFEGAIMRGANAASTVLIGTPAINRVAATAGATAWVIALTADTTNGGLAVTVTGAASTTIRWVCKAETTEVTF